MSTPHNSTSVNWRTIADRLAERLSNHAYCDDHGEPQDGCPFCADRSAYAAYVKAAQLPPVPPPPPSIPIDKVKPHWPIEDGGS